MAKKKQDQAKSSAGAARDPYADREAQNYDNPIPSREYIMELMGTTGEPMSYEDLCGLLSMQDEDQREALRRRLIAMARDGQLISNRRGVYGLVDRMELLKGRIQGSREGYGFFVPVDGSGDLFLGPNEMQKVFDGDIVLARVSGVDRRGRREGMIVEVLERRSKQIVGRYYWEQGFGVVVPDNRRINQEIMIPEKEHKGAEDGQFVVAEITAYPTQRRKAVGRIVEILGDSMKPGMEIDVAVRSHDIPHEWPAEVSRFVRRLKTSVPESDIQHRVDLRDKPFVTIDGEDAKDFDDAVYCEAGPRGTYILSVAIADVSHYVKPDSPLDTEAQNRGNSVYFPGHVIPMLPEVLSNGLCSLKPEVDRLVMVCEMKVSSTGKVTGYTFYEGVIHSHARLTYTEVSDMMEEQSSEARQRSQQRLRKRYEALMPDLDLLYELYQKLRSSREQAGALDFSSNETRIVFGETRKIREIVPVVRNHAHRLVEECMLAANVCTARFLAASELPVLYRVHEGPNMDKLDNLREYLREFGLVLSKSSKPEPRDYQRLLKAVEERPDAHLIQTMLIRSMLQAVYQPENIGHFGLGFDAYTHFTSPIRRYPDLLVHRALRYLIRKPASTLRKLFRAPGQEKHVRKVKGAEPLQRSAIYPYQLPDMQELGENCSVTERRADGAVYDVVDWLKCEYIQDRVGDEFDGTVTSVTNFGLFVELNDIYVEGLVHITALKNDYYKFDPVRQLLLGEHSGNRYHLGDPVRVQVVRVDLDDRKIDLGLVDGVARPAKAGKKRGAKRGFGDESAGQAGKAKAGKGRTATEAVTDGKAAAGPTRRRSRSKAVADKISGAAAAEGGSALRQKQAGGKSQSAPGPSAGKKSGRQAARKTTDNAKAGEPKSAARRPRSK